MQRKTQKLLIIGHARHGKDTVAELFQKLLGLQFQSSSRAAANILVFPVLREKYEYKTVEECFEDRLNHRAEWFDMICEYNKQDPARLARELLSTADIYVGMRSKGELEACRAQKVFDLIIWVDASHRFPAEDTSSCTVTAEMADIVVSNNGTLRDLTDKMTRICRYLAPEQHQERTNK